MTTYKVLDKAIDLSGFNTPLKNSNIATVIGKDNLDKLCKVLNDTSNKRIAYFWQKYAGIAKIVNSKYSYAGGVCCKDEIQFNLLRDSYSDESIDGKFHVLFHESTHAIDYMLGQNIIDSKARLATLATFTSDPTKTLDTAMLKDREIIKALRKESKKSVAEFNEFLKDNLCSKFIVKNSYGKIYQLGKCGYSLPYMVLWYTSKPHELFAEVVAIAITQPDLFNTLKNYIPNTIDWFVDNIINALTPEFGGFVVKCYSYIDKKGKVKLNFNNVYSLNQMWQKLEAKGFSNEDIFQILKTAIAKGKINTANIDFDNSEAVATSFEANSTVLRLIAKQAIDARQAAQKAA